MATLALKLTARSDTRFWDFSGDTVGSEGVFSNITTILREKLGFIAELLPFLSDEPWSYEKDDTAKAIPSPNLLVFDDYIDVIESPVMPPKKEFRVELIVRSIERGKPSICDDFEIW